MLYLHAAFCPQLCLQHRPSQMLHAFFLHSLGNSVSRFKLSAADTCTCHHQPNSQCVVVPAGPEADQFTLSTWGPLSAVEGFRAINEKWIDTLPVSTLMEKRSAALLLACSCC